MTETKKGLSGTKLVALIAVVALVSLAAGVAVMQFIVSPAEIAARTAPPEAGPVTAPVEERVIENTVIMRGEITYADPLEIEIDTAGLTERAVVTGRLPKEGDILKTGDVAIELAGRPVIVLQGELPAYRSLQVGMSGPDVKQLKEALAGLDIWPGDLGSDVFDADTAWAVAELFERVGYASQTGGDEAQQRLRMAERSVRDANVGVTAAQAEVRRAEEAEEDMTVAWAQLESANEMLWDAWAELEQAQIGVMPSLPSSEVVYVSSLPRRVDAVYVKRGDVLQGKAMSVSGATLTIQGSVARQDADLLDEELIGFYPGPEGTELEAKILSVTAPAAKSEESGGEGAERYTVRLSPGELSSEEISQLRGTNVRVRIPVESTDGEVLAVPIAALSAGSAGENRVELLVPNDKDPFNTEIIPVKAGLAADGFVEISSDDARIKPGAKIVVGR